MSEYLGICRGGPLDNKQLMSEQRIEHVRYCDNALWVSQGAFPEFVTGQYRFVLGQWIWRAPGDFE